MPISQNHSSAALILFNKNACNLLMIFALHNEYSQKYQQSETSVNICQTLDCLNFKAITSGQLFSIDLNKC